MDEIELSYCIVNTSQRELMLRGLDALLRERALLPFASEVLVLDNGSRDGSKQAAREHAAVDEVIALEQRQGKALNDSELLRRARGRYALLLNEDSELLAGATLALHEALERHPDAACAGAKLLRPGTAGTARGEQTAQGTGSDAQSVQGTARGEQTSQGTGSDAQSAQGTARGEQTAQGTGSDAQSVQGTGSDAQSAGLEQACAWRFPTPLTALAGALGLQRLYTVQSRGARTRDVDWCQSSALLVRREAAAQVDYLDPDFFVYSDEVDFAKRLRDAGWRSLYVPSAAAIHHEQLSTGAVPKRRIVELSRNRDLYMRKHHSSAAARTVRWLTALAYAERALAALVLPGHSAKRYWRHVGATLLPLRGEGLREAADVYNRGLRSSQLFE